jgi:hypothetical protein
MKSVINWYKKSAQVKQEVYPAAMLAHLTLFMLLAGLLLYMATRVLQVVLAG